MVQLKTMKQQFDDIIATLPEKHQWYSVTWKYPDKMKAFNKKLNRLVNSFEENSFFTSLYKRVTETINKNDKELIPYGVIFEFKDEGRTRRVLLKKINDLILTKSDSGHPLYVLDHDNKTTRKIGSLFQFMDGASRWSLDNDISLTHKLNIVYIMK